MRGILWFILLGALAWLAWSEVLPRWRESRAADSDGGFMERPAFTTKAEESLATGSATDPQEPEVHSSEGAATKVAEGTPAVPAPTITEPPSPPEEVLRGAEGGKDEFRAELERRDRTELGRLLAHEDRFQVLESYLNDGEGAKLPEATRRLASSFWLALSGHPDEAEELAHGLEGAEGVSSEQIDLLQTALRGEGPRARAASSSTLEPMALGMRMALLERSARAALRRGDAPGAARGWSELLLREIDAPWAPHRSDLREWAADLEKAQAGHRWDPAGEWASTPYEVRPGQSLVLIRKDVLAQQPNLLLCVGQIRRANAIGDRPIQPGDQLRIPTDRARVLVDLDAHFLFYLQGEEVLAAWEVGIGQPGQESPTGTFTVGLKQENPSYMPVGKLNLPFGHPDNPLGTRWLAWHRGEENTSYGIHGTNDPTGIGGEVSNGCIRMLNPEVEVLFDILPLGAEVRVQP
jgi:hypothetical protein